MRTEQVAIYQFEELTDDAKEKARDWYRGCIDADDYTHVIEDAVRMAELLGITIAQRTWTNQHGYTGHTPEIYWSLAYCQGDGASYEGHYQYKPGAVAAITAETGGTDAVLIRIARELQELQRPAFYQLAATITTSGNYTHSGCMGVSAYRQDDKETTDDQDDTLKQLLRDFADWIYDQLRKEDEYLNSDEAIDEAITANEYEFTADGERY